MAETNKRIQIDNIRKKLTTKNILIQFEEFDRKGADEYLRKASKILKTETGWGTGNAQSYWVMHEGKTYPLKALGRMAALQGGYKEKESYPSYWEEVFNDLDFEVIRDYRPPSSTERKGLITSRVGQGDYRKKLIVKFKSKCAILGSGPKEILIASHIVPWADATDKQRLDVENGILLSPLYDALFDRNFISFKNNGKIIISSCLTDTQAKKLALTGKETINVTKGMEKYLKRHRKNMRDIE